MNHSIVTRCTPLLAAVTIWAGTSPARSASVSFTASGIGANGQALQATATFQTLAGNKLQITLANTETGDANTSADLLTAFFFNGATGLSPLSAIVPAGQLEWTTTGSGNSAVTSATTLANDLNVGTQWEYASPSGAPNNATAGISSTGLGLFGQGNFAPYGVNLDGAAYGLLPLGFMTTGGSHDGLSNGSSNPLFENTAIFTLGNWTGNLNGICNVSFQYGTTTTDANIAGSAVPVPEPAITSCVLLGFGALAYCQHFTRTRGSRTISSRLRMKAPRFFSSGFWWLTGMQAAPAANQKPPATNQKYARTQPRKQPPVV